MSEKQVVTSLEEQTKQAAKKAEIKRALKYLMFTTSAGMIQFFSFMLLFYAIFGKSDEAVHDVPYWISYVIALVLSVIWNFTFNRKFTFKSANNVPIAMFKVFCYYLVFTPLSAWWGQALTNLGWHELLVLGFTMLINLITEFTFCRFVVFGASLDTNDLAAKDKAKAEQEGAGIAQDESKK